MASITRAQNALEEAQPLLDSMDTIEGAYRTVFLKGPGGRTIYKYQALTEADFLDPQEGDQFMQGQLHNEDCEKAKSIFRYRHRHQPSTVIFSDVKFAWGIEDLKGPAPDVAVVPNVRDPERPRTWFYVEKEGTRPIFILEIVSPDYRQADLEKKIPIYAQAKIEEYFIIDSHLQPKSGRVNYEVIGYRLRGAVYEAIQPDERGWLYSATNDVWIGANEQRDGFIVVDADTDERILPDQERADAEAAARVEAERQLEIMAAELARLRQELDQANKSQ